MEDRFVYSACMGTGCHEHCFHKTYVRDGKILRTEQATLGPPEGGRYGICQKGIEYAKFPYLPARLLHPLKRVGKRGEGKFEQISWDQAMAEIGAKLRSIRDQYGPESVIVNTFACGYPANWTTLHFVLQQRFIHTFGASAQKMEMIDEGFYYATQLDLGRAWPYGQYDPRLLANTRYLLIWGSNPIGATRAAATTRNMLDAQERGASLVNIGLTYDSTAAKSDLFVPVKGGTDAALALAMNHMLIEENLYDRDYVLNHTVAPFLIRDDNGKFLRESDITSSGNPKNYVFWDKSKSEARAIAAEPHDAGISGADLFAAVTVSGISCKTAFLKLRDHLADWTPEHQEQITGVKAEMARQLTHEYVANKPATIWLNLGLRYYNAREAHRAIHLLSALSGNLGLKNGKLALIAWNDGWPVRMNDGPVLFPDGPDKAKGTWEPTFDFLESFRRPGGTKYKALINAMGNPLHAMPNRKMWVEEILPKLDLIVSYEVRVTDTALFADYVLPDTTTLERMELLLPVGNWAVLQEPAIEPLGEAKPTADFWRDLAEKSAWKSISTRRRRSGLSFVSSPPTPP